MEIISVLIPIALLFVIIAVVLFFWAVKSEQFDDLDRQGVSILFDEKQTGPELKTELKNEQKPMTEPEQES